MQRRLHVVPNEGKWAAKRENAERATRITESQREAIRIARDLAMKTKSEVFIHGKDGKIRERNSYGNDPYPPKG